MDLPGWTPVAGPWNAPIPVPHAYPPAQLGSRPLSDIREITEPSLFDSVRRSTVRGEDAATPLRRSNSAKRKPLPTQIPLAPQHSLALRVENIQDPPIRPESRHSRAGSRHAHKARENDRLASPVRKQENRKDLSIPPASLPRPSPPKSPRRPSHSLTREPVPSSRSQPRQKTVSNRGKSTSPVKEIAHRLCPEDAYKQRIPSRTIIKIQNPASNNILDHPTHQHPRIKVDLQVAAPLFVGGSSVEGSVRIIVDDAQKIRHKRSLTLEKLSIDLLGVEEVSGSRRHVFLSLGNELVDIGHPPPDDMVESQHSRGLHGRSWILVSSISTLPFLLTLPLEVGPPPFQSKNARIRYVLCATLTIKDAGRDLCVRCSQDTAILSVYDPEKALVSLSSPLTASDEHVPSQGHGSERIVTTAGLHRQVWVAGTTIFADVLIINSSHKAVKRLEVSLERIILCYRHAAAATLEMSASQARLFDHLERSTVCRKVLKSGSRDWTGVLPHSRDLRTITLDIPRGHATIKCNKYFEVRYYLNIAISGGSTNARLAAVQLPIIVIHMNSLDVPTNSVAQVAAAIEEKRCATAASRAPSRSSPARAGRDSARPRTVQGRAFSAPRHASLDRQRTYAENLREVGEQLDASPRRAMRAYRSRQQAERQATITPTPRTNTPAFDFKTPPSNRRGRIINDGDASALRRRLGGHTRAASGATHASKRSNASRTQTPAVPVRAASALGSYGVGVARRGGRDSGDDGWHQVDEHAVGVFPPPVRLRAKQSVKFGKVLGGERWRPGWL